MEQRLEYRIFTYSAYLQQKFGRKVFRVGLSTGVPCPHREKTGGCIFCNAETFTGEYQAQGKTVSEQLNEAIPRIKKSCGNVSILAYFQDETSTAGSIEFLKRKFAEALSHPEIIGLIVSTRPDYVNEDVVNLLNSFRVPVTIEIGLQSIHNKSLRFLKRGHSFEDVDAAISLCGAAGLEVGVHLIMGIPGETEAEMRQTIEYISANNFINQVKFHNLVVYKNTKLAESAEAGQIELLSIPAYIKMLAELLPYLRGNISVSRLFTSNIRHSQIAIGDYSGNKTKWMNELRKYIYSHGITQGSKTGIEYDYRKHYSV
ncbi:MAG TPA: TIGR01212 family radical SAM protein [Candidatus Cloacimonadota bacterium]|nr:TIGR01212 family radical SAM protein [Candidatus Cloacimonadota bacterium]